MNKMILAILVLGSLSAYADKQPFERYQTIIDRMPFGQPPVGFDPTKNPDEVGKNDYPTDAQLTEEQEAIQKAVQFSVINVEPDGTVRVGFSDRSDPGTPRHYYMSVGEEKGGWVVKAADAAAKSMTIAKDGVEVALKLGENSGGDASATVAKGKTMRASAAGQSAPLQTRSALLNRPLPATAGSGLQGGPESFRGRRARKEEEQRMEEERRAEAEARAEERRRQEEDDRAAREQERAEQREQLKAIQDELRRAREEQQAAQAAREAASNAADDGDQEEEEE